MINVAIQEVLNKKWKKAFLEYKDIDYNKIASYYVSILSEDELRYAISDYREESLKSDIIKAIYIRLNALKKEVEELLTQ